jgi:hypothetical protein
MKKEGKKEIEEKVIRANITEKQKKENNNLLRNILFILGFFVLFFILGFYFTNSTKHFEYDGIKFNIIKEKEVTFYHTSFAIAYLGGDKANYNAFLRNDPRQLEEILFTGPLYLSEMMVLNSSENFNCDGDGVIAIANFQQILNAIGTQVISDPNARCDELGRYMYVNIQSGEETTIEKVGPKCYNINIANCGVLEGTERFLLETLKQTKKDY